MASNIAKAISAHEFYVSINSQFDRQWRDFTLQKGHIFGYSPDLDGGYSNNPMVKGMTGFFVLNRAMSNGLLLYVARMTPDRYVWEKYAVGRKSRTGKKILEVLAKRNGAVTFKPIDAGYNPPLTTLEARGPYIPMRNMRIPMGAWKLPVKKAEHDFRGISAPTKYNGALLAHNIDIRIEWEFERQSKMA